MEDSERGGEAMERTETEQGLFFDETVAKVWPIGERPSCVHRGPYSDGRVSIVKHPDCPPTLMAEVKAMYERRWRERHSD